MAKMANGHAYDLASAVLLATKTKILLAPAMNPSHVGEQGDAAQSRAAHRRRRRALSAPMKARWRNPASAASGRMAEPLEIAAAVEKQCSPRAARFHGKRVLVTSGPTHEPIDPVRYIANRSSGKQGHAIAAAAPRAGAGVTLVSGPVTLPDPPGVTVIKVETARDMLDAVQKALPVDAAIFAAAVADWRVANASAQKIKKKPGHAAPESPARGKSRHSRHRRASQIAAAKTGDRLCRRDRKRRRQCAGKAQRKGCDWILANDVSSGHRHHGRRPQHHPARDGERHRGLAATIERGRGGDAYGADCCSPREIAAPSIELSLRLSHRANGECPSAKLGLRTDLAIGTLGP